jgi:hypothetical protein
MAIIPPRAGSISGILNLPALPTSNIPSQLLSRACRLCIEEDEVELIIADLIEDIIQKSQDVLFEKHISSQVLPYAVQFAKDTIISVAEVLCTRFLRDVTTKITAFTVVGVLFLPVIAKRTIIFFFGLAVCSGNSLKKIK